MKVVSALGNRQVQERFGKDYPDIEFLAGDLDYQEGVLEALKLMKPEALLVSDAVEGELDKYGFVGAIRETDDAVKVVLITGEEDGEYFNWLAKKGVFEVFVDGKCSFGDIYEALKREQKVIVKTKIEKEYIEKEKVVVKVKVEKEKVLVKFKKLIVAVFGFPEFACELAYAAAKLSGLNVLLMDLDTLNATADAYLNVPKHPPDIKSFDNIADGTGLNICLNAADRKALTREILIEASAKKLKNLYVLTGNYNLSNFEYYGEQSLAVLLDKAYEVFDATFLMTNTFIYDAFTLLALKRSDYILAPVRGDRVSLRETARYLSFLEEKQDISLEKARFAVFEHKSGLSLDKNIINGLVRGKLIGCVGYCPRREKYRSLKPAYAKNMGSKALEEYAEILAAFGMAAKTPLAAKARALAASAARRLKKALRRGKKVEHAAG